MALTPIPTGTDTQVNTTTSNDQAYSSVTALNDGGFVVTWSSNGQDGSGWGVYGQRYGADGSPVGGEFRANTYTSGDQSYSSVTALNNGGFVVTWSSDGQDGNVLGVYGQRYAADGSPVGSEFRANTFTSNHQAYSSVTALNDGGFLVTWSSGGQDGSNMGIYGQRYAADGAPVGDEFRANPYTYSDQLYSSVTALNDGGFVVTWSSSDQDGSGLGIYGQRYATDGTPVGDEFRANTYTSSEQRYSSVTALNDGGFVVTWSSNDQDGSGDGIYGQRYAADGTPVGDEFRANTYTTYTQTYSSVTALNDGGFVVTWSSDSQDGRGYGIYGQRYAADGSPAGSEFAINQITADNQFAETFYGSETVATLADGHLVQVWTGNRYEEVFFRLIDVPSANTAPTLALANVLTSLSENTDTTSRVKVADLTITDDGGNNEPVAIRLGCGAVRNLRRRPLSQGRDGAGLRGRQHHAGSSRCIPRRNLSDAS